MSWLDDVKEHGSEALFWAIETAYQMKVIGSQEYRKRMNEYHKINKEEVSRKLEKILK